MTGERGAGRTLAEVRRTAGLTQEQAAAKVRIDRTTLLRMEAGRNPAVACFVRLFKLMGYDLIAVPRGSRVRVDADPDGAER